MAWTTPITWADGGTPTAAQFNQQLRDNFGVALPAIAQAAGDLFYAAGSANPARLAIGTQGRYLEVSAGTLPAWQGSALPIIQEFVISSDLTGINSTSGANPTGHQSADLQWTMSYPELWLLETEILYMANTVVNRGTPGLLARFDWVGTTSLSTRGATGAVYDHPVLGPYMDMATFNGIQKLVGGFPTEAGTPQVAKFWAIGGINSVGSSATFTMKFWQQNLSTANPVTVFAGTRVRAVRLT